MAVILFFQRADQGFDDLARKHVFFNRNTVQINLGLEPLVVFGRREQSNHKADRAMASLDTRPVVRN
jgi:hypothetical protein